MRCAGCASPGPSWPSCSGCRARRSARCSSAAGWASSAAGLERAERYERGRPGELIHIDIKKLGRIQGGAGKRITGVRRNPDPTRRDAAGVDRRTIGWEYVHVAVDDATRLAYAEVLDDEKAVTATAFLRRAVRFFARHGITVERVLTDG